MITLKIINKKEPLKAKFGIKFPDIVPSRLQEKTIEPTKEVQEVVCDKNYDGLSKVTVEAIPEEYIIPEGMLPITENKTYDVTNYAKVSASVHLAPNLQDKDIEITENGSQTITADEGYDGLGNVNITTNAIEDLESELTEQNNSLQTQTTTIDDIVKALKGKASGGDEPDLDTDPDYIKDGLVAWWEGCDDVDSNIHWKSRVGDDYIYNPTTSGMYNASIYSNYHIIKSEKGYQNNMTYGLVTTQDYYKTGYTIEVVGKTKNGANNAAYTSNVAAPLIAFDKGDGPMIANFGSDGYFACVNISQGSGMPKMFRNCYGKRYKYAIALDQIVPRGTATGYHIISYALNNSQWYQKSQTYASNTYDHGNRMTVLTYYYNNYKSNSEINSIRVYNRKLTEEELRHNYEIDKARFKLNDYVEEGE